MMTEDFSGIHPIRVEVCVPDGATQSLLVNNEVRLIPTSAKTYYGVLYPRSSEIFSITDNSAKFSITDNSGELLGQFLYTGEVVSCDQSRITSVNCQPLKLKGYNKLDMNQGYNKLDMDQGYNKLDMDQGYNKLDMNLPGIVSVGHRGFGATVVNGRDGYIENTMHAFNAAIAHGFSWVEFDVQVTSDGIPVVYHNFSIGKNNKHISELSLSELRCLFREQLGTDSSPDSEVELPTLEDLFKKLPSNVGFNVELKYPGFGERKELNTPWYPAIHTWLLPILDVISKYPDRKIYVSSFHTWALMEWTVASAGTTRKMGIFKLLSPGDDTCHDDYDSLTLEKSMEIVRMANWEGIVLDADVFDSISHTIKFTTYCNELGLLVYCYGLKLNDIGHCKELIDAGVRGIISDKHSL